MVWKLIVLLYLFASTTAAVSCCRMARYREQKRLTTLTTRVRINRVAALFGRAQCGEVVTPPSLSHESEVVGAQQ